MKTKLIILPLLLSSLLQSAELRIGRGNFSCDMSVMKFMDTSFDLDINVAALSNPHDNFSDSSFYYFYNAEIYASSFADKMTTLATYPITYDIPLLGSINDAIAEYTPIAVPSEYKVRGFDLDLGVGYDLYHENNNYIGIGISTGLSMPVMKMKNLRKSAEMIYSVLDATDTTILTYKLGTSLQAGVEILPTLFLEGSASLGYQTGYVKNDWFASSFDVDGEFKTFNVALKYVPFETHTEFAGINVDPQLYFVLGFTHKTWDMDKAKVNMGNIFSVESFGMCDIGFEANYTYFGIGYNF
ncbi:hypothetical protein [Sulfurovum sp.]|uniref:hypothetical protein n=1 Tax=Sulfurovum sp. TaxID=1969726 RepID=UPI0025D6FA93|nr:hypothetical protein [Sulfurovum sp.]